MKTIFGPENAQNFFTTVKLGQNDAKIIKYDLLANQSPHNQICEPKPYEMRAAWTEHGQILADSKNHNFSTKSTLEPRDYAESM